LRKIVATSNNQKQSRHQAALFYGRVWDNDLLVMLALYVYNNTEKH